MSAQEFLAASRKFHGHRSAHGRRDGPIRADDSQPHPSEEGVAALAFSAGTALMMSC